MAEYIPDNYDIWAANEARKEAALADCYVCDECKHPIQDDSHYEINGDFLCAKCVDKLYKVND